MLQVSGGSLRRRRLSPTSRDICTGTAKELRPMRFFPPSTNATYSGSLVSAYFLTLFSVLTILPGCIHTFAPDGGAGTIAGLDLSQNGRVIIAVFAWAGATQIAFGLATLIVSLRYRSLVPLMLGLAIIERSLHALNAW